MQRALKQRRMRSRPTAFPPASRRKRWKPGSPYTLDLLDAIRARLHRLFFVPSPGGYSVRALRSRRPAGGEPGPGRPALCIRPFRCETVQDRGKLPDQSLRGPGRGANPDDAGLCAGVAGRNRWGKRMMHWLTPCPARTWHDQSFLRHISEPAKPPRAARRE